MNRSRLNIFIFTCFLSMSPFVFGQTTSTSVKEVKSVWDLSLQPCNGGGGNLMKRNANEAEIKEKKIIKLNEAGFQFAIPQIPNLETTYIKLFLNDKSRGVTDHYILLTKADLAPPVAAIVITQLPAGIQTTAGGLGAVKILQEQSARRAGIQISLTPIAGPYGDSLELLIKDRVGSHCYPTSDYQVSDRNGSARTLGISRFSVIGDKLIEFAEILEIPARMSDEQAAEYARKAMDTYWLSLKPI